MILDFNSMNVEHELNDVHVTVEEMVTKLASVNVSKSPGPDQCHPRMLKELAPVLAYPFTLLFANIST